MTSWNAFSFIIRYINIMAFIFCQAYRYFDKMITKILQAIPNHYGQCLHVYIQSVLSTKVCL